MDYDGFINRNLGKSIDFDGAYGAQCCDEVNQYLADNGKVNCIPWGENASGYANHPKMLTDFVWTDNNPSDIYQIPKRGDIMVWASGLPGSGGAGHIAIWDMVVRAGVFQSLDQNWGGQYVHFVSNHDWSYVLGWFSLKTPPAPPQPVPVPAPVPPVPQPDPAPANPPVDETQLTILKTVQDNNSLLKQILALLQALVDKITGVFK